MIECRRLLFGSDRLADIVQLLPLPQQITIQFGRAIIKAQSTQQTRRNRQNWHGRPLPGGYCP
jgi:hypothetical protein